MAHSRKFFTVGALGVASFALIGAGATATFSDNVQADQSITAGDLNVSVRGPAGSSTDGKTVTLAPVGPVSSTFTTGPQRVFALNSGNIGAHAVRLSASATGNTRSLHSEMYVKIVRWSGANGTGSDIVIYNNTLTYLESHPISVNGPQVAPAGWDQFDVTFYAGHDGADSLSNPSQRGVLVPKITFDYEG
jgi:predicted ribosomally synthesized peptide with SipW-like signal peptide